MVSFGCNENGTWAHYCGGAIVAENVIVTASHCFFKRRSGYKRLTQIRTGDQNFIDTTDDDLVATYEISSIIKHPEYQWPGRGAKHDLAIVFTKTRIEFNANTNQISLPPIEEPIQQPNTNYSAEFCGYGFYDTQTTASEALRSADFTIFTGTYCEPWFGHRKIKEHLVNTSILMCAGTDVS